MTAQFEEKIRYKGKLYRLFNLPLEQFFEVSGGRPQLDSNCSACWRGYIGHWKIRYDRLYLVTMEEPILNLDGGSDLLKAVFPDSDGAVFAEWFTGTLKLIRGKPIKESNSELENIDEQETEVEVKEGIVVSERIQRRQAGQPLE